MTISAAMTAAGGCFYAQDFLFVDAGIAFGPWISVEALLAPIIGGMGTVFGPLLGALVLHVARRAHQARDRRAPGLDLVIYGVVLIWSSPSRRAASPACCRPARASSAGSDRGARPWLSRCSSVENVSKRFGGLLAVTGRRSPAEPGRSPR